MMNCRTAVLTAIDSSPRRLTGKNAVAAKRARDERHPLLWLSLQSKIQHAYQEETGKRLRAGFDWEKLLDWLLENLPAILAMILAIFGA